MLDRQPVAPFSWSEQQNRHHSGTRSGLQYRDFEAGFGESKTGNCHISFDSNTANNNNNNNNNTSNNNNSNNSNNYNNDDDNNNLYHYHSAPSSLMDTLAPAPPHGSLCMGCMGPGPEFAPGYHGHPPTILLHIGSCPARVDGWDDPTSAHSTLLFNGPDLSSSTAAAAAATTSGCGASREKQFNLTSDMLMFDPVALCRTRAKRGFATHPRSIAERVRRTKISDGIKKLQDLLPNIDKQANTADMLGEAIEYIRSLQQEKQKELQEALEDLCKKKKRPLYNIVVFPKI